MAAATLIRLALLAVPLTRTGTNGIISADTSSYLIPGRNLLLHGCFFADGVPDLVRTPGYPLFFAITSQWGMAGTAVAGAIVSVLSVLLVWKLARTAFMDDRIALVAAWIFAFEPLSVLNSIYLLSDTLYVALFLLSLERLAEFLHRRRLRVLVVAGLWLAAATFVRPVSYYLPVAWALGLFLVLVRKKGLRWKAPAVLLIGVLPWLAAWQVRNWVETGYSGFASITEVNLYFFTAAEVIANVEHRSFHDTSTELGYVPFVDQSGQSYLSAFYISRHPEQAGWSQGPRLAYMHTEAVRVIRAHIMVYLRAGVISAVKMVFNPGAGFFDHLLIPQSSLVSSGLIDASPVSREILLLKTHFWVAAEKAFFQVILLTLYFLAARNVFYGGKLNSCRWLLLGVALYFVVVTGVGGGVGADARLRLPVMPIVCMFAAAGVIGKKRNGVAIE
ncbi:MAG: glycosyltransferase family 39 protein [Terracidiphilus sp.]|jgi:hypothetical protein